VTSSQMLILRDFASKTRPDYESVTYLACINARTNS
jgi:hypothetical protein